MDNKGLAINVQSKELNLSTDDVKQYIAPNATDKELYFFMNIARSYGLNPFKREIHFAKYGNSPGQVIVGYETYIKRAERTGQLDGWSVWIEKDDVGEKAVIEIHRKDRSRSFRWEVYREEFDKKQSTWKAMPHFMLKKVAISQGFRLAFPEEVGGMPYTPDEINAGASEDLPKGDVVDAEYSQQPQQSQAQPQPQGDGMITQAQLKKLATVLTNLGVTDRTEKLNMVNAWLENNGHDHISSSKELTKEQATAVIDALQSELEAANAAD